MAKSRTFRILSVKTRRWLSRLSFRTGVIVLAFCIPCYLFSFLQMLLPITAVAKSALWVVFFGLAKTFQYGGLLILGAEGVRALKKKFRRRTAESAS